MKNITILGSTGSIGMNTLDVIRQHPEYFTVYALTAYSQVDKLLEQCLQFQPRYAVMVDKLAAKTLREQLKHHHSKTEVLMGAEALVEIASAEDTDYVMAAIVGAAGLLAGLAAARAGKRVLLANKEALVMSGQLFMQAIEESGAELLPIDSEHNAIFQCMPTDGASNGVEEIILTASGGPFLHMPLSALARVTPDQACAHPKWKMGRKISVDSATMMNKALEIIEAHYLFKLDPKAISAVIHPQSIVHSMVRYCDGSILAQMGHPDMRIPIAYGLAWPNRLSSGVKALNLIDVSQLDFRPLDTERFPSVALAYQVLQQGGTMPTIFNAANEVAVAAFLQEQITFTQIGTVVETVLNQSVAHAADTIEQILLDDACARELAKKTVNALENA